MAGALLLRSASAPPLTTLALLHTKLSVPALLTLPATLTHLALLGLPGAVPLHRLPGICPLLVVLDLSFNAWLDCAAPTAQEKLLAVGWRRWLERDSGGWEAEGGYSECSEGIVVWIGGRL